MKDVLLRRSLGGFLAIVAILILSSVIAACASMGMSCDFDSDCDHGELCVEYMCASPCTSDQQCEGDNTCQVFIRDNESDQVHVCMDPFVSNKNNDDSLDSIQCTTDEECRDILGSAGAICGLGYRCVGPETGASPEAGRKPYNSVLIRDLTSRALVDDEGHSGMVLSTVFVRDEGGSIVGYGDTLEFISGNESGGQTTGHLDGQPVQLDDSGQCVVGAEAPVSVLGGDGGRYLVGFVDYQGMRIVLGQGWKIIVITRGGQCSEPIDSSEVAGEYELSLCASQGGENSAYDANCEQIGGKVSGYAEFLVTTSG